MELKEIKKETTPKATTAAPKKDFKALSLKLGKLFDTQFKGLSLYELGYIMGLTVKKRVLDKTAHKPFISSIKKGLNIKATV